MTEEHHKRLRIFAGPNGSGKSTLVDNLASSGKFSVNVFVNADVIEKKMRETEGILSLNQYGIPLTTTQSICNHIGTYGMSPKKISADVLSQFSIDNDNNIRFEGSLHSYIAADIADFIRYQLLKSGASFIFETVFSSETKLQIIKDAKQLGYRVYLYFITTEDPDINVGRVANRVSEGGHAVPEEKIRSRYYRSLGLLRKAAKLCNRAYLFDNSELRYRFIAEINEGNVDTSPANDNIPDWFIKYIYNKK